MLEKPKGLDLSEFEGTFLVQKFLLELLDCNKFSGAGVASFVNRAEGTGSFLAEALILA